MLGLELRKIDNTKRFYREIDQILSQNDIPTDGGVSKGVQIEAIAHSLQKMLDVNRHFDVCTIRTCAEIADIVISKERMDIYSSIHCMNWNQMLPDFRKRIVAMVMDDFRSVFVDKADDIQEVTIVE